MPARTDKLIKFYHTREWYKVRQLKIQKARGICERCGKQGTEVHHKIYLKSSNVNDATISLSLDNLELLCKACHNAEHDRASKQIRKDVAFNEYGDMITPPPKKVR